MSRRRPLRLLPVPEGCGNLGTAVYYTMQHLGARQSVTCRQAEGMPALIHVGSLSSPEVKSSLLHGRSKKEPKVAEISEFGNNLHRRR